MSIKSEIKTITPEYAAELLRSNTRNRPLNKRRVSALASAMKRDEWRLNGDAIRISCTGVVLDGQHRLSAIVESGVAVDSFIIYGLPDDVFDTIDVGGRARTTGDVLAIRGEQNYNAIAAIARLIYKHENYKNPFHGSPESTPTAQQIIQLIDDNPSIRDSVSFITRSRWCKRNMNPSIGGFAHFVFTRKDAAAAAEFFEQLEKGTGFSDGSPVLLLRDRLAESLTDKVKMSQGYKTALIFKAFRLFLDDAIVKTLRVRTQGTAPETDFFNI